MLTAIMLNIAAKSQSIADVVKVDSLTYAQWSRGEWTALNRTCDSALRHGIDFYYLRLRHGIAYYERKKVRHAMEQFNKADRILANQPVCLEYLYFCYLYTEQYEQALRVSSRMEISQAHRLGIVGRNDIDGAMMSAGFKTTDSTGKFNNPLFFSAGLTHHFSRQWTVSHLFTYFSQQEQRFSFDQYQYYLSVAIPMGKRWVVRAAGHGIYLESVLTPTLGRGSRRSIANESHERVTGMWVSYAGITGNYKYVTVNAGLTGGWLDTIAQVQVSAGAMIYPFGNNRLGLGGVVYLHGVKPFSEYNVAVSPSIRWIPGKRWSVTAGYFVNQGANICENAAAYVNNSYDPTLKRTTMALGWQATPEIGVQVLGGIENKQLIASDIRYKYYIMSLGINITPTH